MTISRSYRGKRDSLPSISTSRFASTSDLPTATELCFASFSMEEQMSGLFDDLLRESSADENLLTALLEAETDTFQA